MKKKILLVDDDQDLVRSFQVFLESNDFHVITAATGKEGLAKLKSEKPDALVLDIMMESSLDGYNNLHTIKNDPEFKSLPVIVLTGMATELGVNLQSGVIDENMFPNVLFRDKPIDPLILLDLIREVLN